MKVLAKPIDVVAWFTKEGTPRPVRFRVTNEEESETVIKVDKILHVDRENLQVITCWYIGAKEQ